MRQLKQSCLAGLVLSGAVLTASVLPAAEPSAGELRSQHEAIAAKAISFLLNKGRASDGSYSSFSGPGVTSLVTTALLRNGVSPSDPRIAESLAYIRERIQPDGGIYQTGSLYRNYETCLAVLCFTEVNRDGKYDETLKHADAFLKGIQWDESEGKEESDLGYGGAGYGKHKRPDLSNTTFLIEALKSTGNGADSEAMQRALAFVSRCQNLESEHNTTAFATKNPDGGFYYTAAAGGSSQAGTTDSGGLRSYASMTYAGLKSMIYAGVGPEDQRVKAAYTWIGKNYDLASNPGMGSSGLYYYYHTFAKALDAMRVEQVEDEAGAKHNWRAELIRELAKRQQPDGSWLNENDRWLEGDPNLVTGYALLALSYCKPK
ncbi:MAG: terpene cyclase/mutase family protein [Planctomycetes bacterium]|nr:terpene cyclase/mutase family protein [Planctomycetota bacterium]MBL7044636.1 terpene cyclase/mutase family protein [Pirellulaceae bacterium]